MFEASGLAGIACQLGIHASASVTGGQTVSENRRGRTAVLPRVFIRFTRISGRTEISCNIRPKHLTSAQRNPPSSVWLVAGFLLLTYECSRLPACLLHVGSVTALLERINCVLSGVVTVIGPVRLPPAMAVVVVNNVNVAGRGRRRAVATTTVRRWAAWRLRQPMARPVGTGTTWEVLVKASLQLRLPLKSSSKTIAACL